MNLDGKMGHFLLFTSQNFSLHVSHYEDAFRNPVSDIRGPNLVKSTSLCSPSLVSNTVLPLAHAKISVKPARVLQPI